MQTIYRYMIARGVATLARMRGDGTDIDEPVKQLGSFKTDEQARQACEAHHLKACRAARALGRPEPVILWS
jgi:hypothetical protein